jgi:acetate kinase
MNILTLNTGSNSLKFEIVAAEPAKTKTDKEISFGRSILSGAYDNIGGDHSTFSLLEGKRIRQKEEMEVRDHRHAAELLLDWIEQGNARDRGVGALADIERIGHRVVHGADRFSGPVRITDQVLHQIEELEDLAPLHNKPAVEAVRAAQKKLGSRLPMIAVFDTVFHRTIPDKAAIYPLPLELAQRHKIRRYGFHGISHRYLMLRYAQLAERSLSAIRLITLHLEGGSSAAAIQHGRSIDTSMGFTPLEGLMMGTRSGDIDPAIVTYLMRKEKLDGPGIEKLLNKQCGLLGVSGTSADTRELQAQLSNDRVNLSLDMFCYRVRKYIGAYLAALDGAEAVVFGGGIGENTPVVRERICKGLSWCGVNIDAQRNKEITDREGAITTPESSIQVWVIPTEEGLMMASDVANCE